MKVNGYSLDFSTVFEQMKKNHWHRILLQVPEGLKHKALSLCTFVEQQTKSICYVQVDPCYGACDLVSPDQLAHLDIDAVIQIGHLPIPSMKKDMQKTPYFFVNALSTHNVISVVEKALSSLEGTKIGILTTAQHINQLENISSLLKKKGFKPILSPGDNRIMQEGQILGCNFSAGKRIADEVDSFLFVGSGLFHALGLLLVVNKLVVIADPYSQQVKKDELIDLKDSILRQRYGAIAQAKTANTFGILLGLKSGQQRRKLAEKLYSFLRSKNISSFLLTVDHITPSYLEGFPSVDCFVSTLCPRIAIDDYAQFKKPVLTPVELDIALGNRSWEQYRFDEIVSEKNKV